MHLMVSRALLILAGVGLLVLAACDDGSPTTSQGEVQGLVVVEGVAVGSVTVELSGPVVRTATTDASGRFSFPGVPPGAYVVSIVALPDWSFSATSRTTVLSAGQSASVDFQGNFVRTASIGGAVLVGGRGLGGVVITLTGRESRTTVTDSNGNFTFAGLRSGDYEVEMSSLPESATFPIVRATVALGTGESQQVIFEGTSQLTASAIIQAITRRAPDGTVTPVEFQDVSGQVEVTLRVDPGGDTLDWLELLIGNEVVGRHFFDIGGAVPEGSGSPQQGGAEVPGSGAAGAPGPFDLVFAVNTGAFDAESGEPRFLNGERMLTARLATVEGGTNAWQSSVPVGLRNRDTVTGRLVPGLGPVEGIGGNDWIGGDLTVELLPVLYTESLELASVTVELRREGAGQLRSRTVQGGGPLTVTFPAEGAPAQDNVVGYRTDAGGTDLIRVREAFDTGGSPLSGVPAHIASDLRIDNQPPLAGTFTLPAQGAGQDCCLSNWVGSEFEFSGAWQDGPHGGAGLVTTTFHAGLASMTDSALVSDGIVVLRGEDLPSTQTNGVYRAVARMVDAFGRQTLVPLAPSDGNALANPRGAVFGIDRTPPSLVLGSQGILDRAVNPPDASSWILQVSPGPSGTGPFPARTRVRLLAPGIGSAGECLFPSSGSCVPVPDGLSRTGPSGWEGYITIETEVVDRAGNRSAPLTATFLRDDTAPRILALMPPAGFVPGASMTIGAQVSDDIDLHRGGIDFRFEASEGGLGFAFAPAVRLGTPFDGTLDVDGLFEVEVPLVVTLERADAGEESDSPSGSPRQLSAVEAWVTDAAGNRRTESISLPSGLGSESESFSVASRGTTGGVRGWNLAVSDDEVCGAEACSEGIPASTTFQATASGESGVLERPFDVVHFLLLGDDGYRWIGSTTQVQSADAPGPRGRTWSWDFQWSPDEDTPVGPGLVIAVGVDAGGAALRTDEPLPVSIKAGD